MDSARYKQIQFWTTRLLVIVAAAWIFAIAPARADVRITVNEEVLEKETAPNQQDHDSNYNFTITLTGKNSAHYSCSDGCNYDINLGQTIRHQNGNTTSYSVQNGVIVIRDNAESYSVVTIIKTNGSTSCSASTQTRLKPGHKFFERYRLSNHEKMYESSLRVNITSCSISTV
jgi:hypothetical protein